MDKILIVLKKENGPRASSAPALGLNTIIFKYVYWHMKQISGERLQDHWSSGFILSVGTLQEASNAKDWASNKPLLRMIQLYNTYITEANF